MYICKFWPFLNNPNFLAKNLNETISNKMPIKLYF